MALQMKMAFCHNYLCKKDLLEGVFTQIVLKKLE